MKHALVELVGAHKVGDNVIRFTIASSLERVGNIDHIFISPMGVWVVEAKACKGQGRSAAAP